MSCAQKIPDIKLFFIRDDRLDNMFMLQVDALGIGLGEHGDCLEKNSLWNLPLKDQTGRGSVAMHTYLFIFS